MLVGTEESNDSVNMGSSELPMDISTVVGLVSSKTLDKPLLTLDVSVVCGKSVAIIPAMTEIDVSKLVIWSDRPGPGWAVVVVLDMVDKEESWPSTTAAERAIPKVAEDDIGLRTLVVDVGLVYKSEVGMFEDTGIDRSSSVADEDTTRVGSSRLEKPVGTTSTEVEISALVRLSGSDNVSSSIVLVGPAVCK